MQSPRPDTIESSSSILGRAWSWWVPGACTGIYTEPTVPTTQCTRGRQGRQPGPTHASTIWEPLPGLEGPAEEAGLCPGAQLGSILMSRGECVTLLGVNGAPGKAEEETEPSLCPKRAPHAAPGSNQPLVVGPCTSLQQEKAKLKADREMDGPQPSTGIPESTARPKSERLDQKLAPRHPMRPRKVRF